MDRIDPSEDSPYEFDDDDGWLTDLETVLLGKVPVKNKVLRIFILLYSLN